MPKNFETDIKSYLSRQKDTLNKLSVVDINKVINVFLAARDEERHIFIMGNGGSAATASHFVCDFNKGASYGYDKRFRFVCLNDNVPSLLAYANDVSYEDVFVEHLKNFFVPKDVVVGISGSGNSKNVIKAIEYANENSGITVGLSGYDGGHLKQIANHNIHIPIDDMQIVEDLHMTMDHLMMQVICSNMDKIDEENKK
ncbi:phosphoheptose isomerase [Endomicrobiia bacterium]|nr:phosphoheptose isomerase [Endomicrobiia bacterium]